MSDPSIAVSLPSFSPPASPATANPQAPSRPMAARTKLLLKGRILPTMLRIAAPNVLNLLAIAGMVTFDGLFLGRLGADTLGGVSLAFPWVMFMQHAANGGMGGGVSSAIARALGAGRRDKADALLCHAFVPAIAVAAIFSTSMLLGAPYVFRWMGGGSEMLSAALAYSNAAFSGAICIVMLNIFANAVRGAANMTLPGVVIMSSVIAHILISPSLIFGWGPIPAMGPAGAGLGLIAPFGVGSLLLIAYLRSPRALITLNFRGVALQWALFAEILKVGVPGLINAGVTNLSVALLTGIASHLGRDAAIGYAMGARLEYILIPIGFGFGAAISAMVGTNWGARQYRRARVIGWMGTATVAATFATVGMVVALFPGMWMGLFSNDEQVVRLGSSYLQIMGPIYGFYGLGARPDRFCDGHLLQGSRLKRRLRG